MYTILKRVSVQAKRPQILKLIAVSYTHLDVYKRQNLERFIRDMGYSKTLVNQKLQSLTGQSIGQFMRKMCIRDRISMMISPAFSPISAAGLPSEGSITVSYTHLDVYKRQALILHEQHQMYNFHQYDKSHFH